jgi:hypothetical protein
LRLIIWIVVILLLTVGLTAWMWTLRGPAAATRLDILRGGWLAFAAGCVALWLLLATTPQEALRLSTRLSKRIVIVLCLLLAAAAVVWLRPVLSAEALRYRFDGRTWLLGLSPYCVSPNEAEALAGNVQDAELRPDVLDQAAPHQERTTLNLPVGQAAFVATRTLEYLSPLEEEEVRPPLAPQTRAVSADWRVNLLDLPWWKQMLFWRCLLAIAYLLAVAELIAWTRYRELSPWWAVVFAWQPVVLMETLGAAHQDMIGVLFLIAGLRRADGGNMRRAALCLAASVAVKPLALLVLPFVLRRALRADGTEAYPPRCALAAPAGPAAARQAGAAARAAVQRRGSRGDRTRHGVIFLRRRVGCGDISLAGVNLWRGRGIGGTSAARPRGGLEHLRNGDAPGGVDLLAATRKPRGGVLRDDDDRAASGPDCGPLAGHLAPGGGSGASRASRPGGPGVGRNGGAALLSCHAGRGDTNLFLAGMAVSAGRGGWTGRRAAGWPAQGRATPAAGGSGLITLEGLIAPLRLLAKTIDCPALFFRCFGGPLSCCGIRLSLRHARTKPGELVPTHTL